MIRRREFLAGLGGAATWPLAARAQQGDRMRRIGVLMPYDENDPEVRLRYSAFTQALADFGWTDGRNLRVDLRWTGADINRMRAFAQELVGLRHRKPRPLKNWGARWARPGNPCRPRAASCGP